MKKIRKDKVLVEKAEQDLEENEKYLSSAISTSSDGLWDWNIETGDVYYSSQWKSMLGYEDDELENTFSTWEKLIHPEDKEKVLQNLEASRDSKMVSFEVEIRMKHKNGQVVFILSRGLLLKRDSEQKVIRLLGTHVDISEQKRIQKFDDKNVKILKMIATGVDAVSVYNEIALMYESRHIGLRCSLLELKDGILLHGGAPSMPKEYCDAINGLKNGPTVGSCGTSTYFGHRVLVEDIATDSKWENIKQYALPHGIRSCWSEPIIDSRGKVLGAFGMYYNYPALPNDEESEDLKSAAILAGIVMERDQSQKRIKELAYKDELTGLANRISFYQEVEKCIGSQIHFGLLYIDIDDFKNVNDTLGHNIGDILLKEIANRLETICRETDYIARLSGDEFCILVREVEEDKHTSAIVAQRCLEVVSRPMELAGRLFTPTCSIGIGYFPEDAKDFLMILKVADMALYFAKEMGKNQYAFYQLELSEKAEYRFKIEQGLREAIEKEQLTLVYQPQVNINTNTLVGFEALARWNSINLGQISPVEFIPIIEKIGMMTQFTSWVLKTACKKAVEWRQLSVSEFKMSINISPKYFLDEKMVPSIQKVIDETGILTSELELEVTESIIQIDKRNLSIFKAIQELGISIALDDFGTGYSSLASLQHLSVDSLKIDKYFIDEIKTDLKSRYLIKSMIELGHYMNYEVVAEGIETKEQLDILKGLGCKVVQGYFFSKPLDTDAVVKYLNKAKENVAKASMKEAK
ncbi:MAG: EAL domain-containing protein [Sulfurimonas sp.]|nr:EAL domain-containing protein [Sulfurimonas sp.]